MSAPIGNQNAKGNRGGRRKGYEYERKQLRRLRILMNEFLDITEGFYKKKTIPPEEIDLLREKIKVGLKVMDKLHADKRETTLKTEEPILINLNL